MVEQSNASVFRLRGSRMDVPIPSTFLSPILTVASVWSTGETGDINSMPEEALFRE